MSTEDRAFLSVTEAGEMLGVSRKTAYNLVRDGAMPVIYLRGVRRVPAGALKRWLAERDEEALEAVRPRAPTRSARAERREGVPPRLAPATARS